MGLEITRRSAHARTMANMRANIENIVRYANETWLAPMLLIRAEVEANADGEYEDGDLQSVDQACQDIRRRLRALADSFAPAP